MANLRITFYSHIPDITSMFYFKKYIVLTKLFEAYFDINATIWPTIRPMNIMTVSSGYCGVYCNSGDILLLRET